MNEAYKQLYIYFPLAFYMLCFKKFVQIMEVRKSNRRALDILLKHEVPDKQSALSLESILCLHYRVVWVSRP